MQIKVNLKKLTQYELETETRLHEDGIVSNRELVCHGEWNIKLCTHRPSHSKNCIVWKLNELRILVTTKINNRVTEVQFIIERSRYLWVKADMVI